MTASTLSNLQTVESISVTAEVDLQHIVNTFDKPLIIKGLVSDWAIVNSCKNSPEKTTDYLKTLSQPMQVGIGKVPANENGRLFYSHDFTNFNFERSNTLFTDFLTSLLAEAKNESPCGYYMGSTHVDKLLPEFNQHNPLPLLDDKNAHSSIWISNRTRVAAHQDFPNNIACCVAGKRRFTLFPPEQIDNLYIGPLDHTPAGQPISLVDINNPDFKRYPKFKQALTHAQVAELSQGDALFLPSLWWHAVDSLTSFNVLINYWWQDSADYMGSPIDALYHAILNISQLSSHQKKAMQALFNYYIFDNDKNTLEHIPNNLLGILEKDSPLVARKIRSLLINKLNR